jgi:hypothetical protein
MDKFIGFFTNDKNIDLVKKIGQMIIFIIVVLLIFFFSLLILFLRIEIQTLLYSICFLCLLLIVWGLSGGVEISFGNFTFKKDISEMKDKIKNMEIALYQNQKQKQKQQLINEFHQHDHYDYYETNDEPSILEDTNSSIGDQKNS